MQKVEKFFCVAILQGYDGAVIEIWGFPNKIIAKCGTNVNNKNKELIYRSWLIALTGYISVMYNLCDETN